MATRTECFQLTWLAFISQRCTENEWAAPIGDTEQKPISSLLWREKNANVTDLVVVLLAGDFAVLLIITCLTPTLLGEVRNVQSYWSAKLVGMAGTVSLLN